MEIFFITSMTDGDLRVPITQEQADSIHALSLELGDNIHIGISHPRFQARCFGFAYDLKTARKWVRENRCDMIECLYDYLVIERGSPGIHPHLTQVEWYRNTAGHDLGDGKWTLCEKPEFSRGVINYALG